jgi:hypothetical protein
MEHISFPDGVVRFCQFQLAGRTQKVIHGAVVIFFVWHRIADQERSFDHQYLAVAVGVFPESSQKFEFPECLPDQGNRFDAPEFFIQSAGNHFIVLKSGNIGRTDALKHGK